VSDATDRVGPNDRISGEGPAQFPATVPDGYDAALAASPEEFSRFGLPETHSTMPSSSSPEVSDRPPVLPPPPAIDPALDHIPGSEIRAAFAELLGEVRSSRSELAVVRTELAEV